MSQTAFPPLVESVLPSCEARWRRTEAALERITDVCPSFSAVASESRAKTGRKSGLTDEALQEAQRLRAAGMSLKAIAAHLHVNKKSLTKSFTGANYTHPRSGCIGPAGSEAA